MKEELLDRYYTREELIKRLQEMGANPKLLKMPAVIERILRDSPLLHTITVNLNGNITYSQRTFELQDDGTVKTSNGVEIDQYGMEKTIENSSIKAKRGEQIHILTFVGPAEGYATDYDNYPGWEIEGAEKIKTGDEKSIKEEYEIIIGETLLEYPQTEGWFVENGFLSQDRENRDGQIIEIIQKSKANFELMLKEEQQKYEREQNMQRDPKLDAMDAARGGFLERIMYAGNPSRENRMELIQKRIETLRQLIEKCDNFERIYGNGDRPTEETEYTEEQAVQNRREYFTQQTEHYTTQVQELEEKNAQLATKIEQLQELAGKCARIPIAGRKIASVLDTQMKLLQEGKTENRENAELSKTDTELLEAYEAYDSVYSHYTDLEETSRKYKNTLKTLKECISRFGRIPLIGKMILKEMDEIIAERPNENQKTDEEER